MNLNSTNSAPPYTNWITAATNIQDAVDASSMGDFIVVSNGTYNTGGRAVYGTSTNRLAVDKAVTVESVNGPGSTVIVGNYDIRCVYLTNGASLIGFTLKNGAVISSANNPTNQDCGGGVWCESVSTTVSNCVLTYNLAYKNGGAAYQGTFNNCIISNNTAVMGGAGTYQANLNNCTVTRNHLQTDLSGGGGAAFGVLSNCLVIQNSAPNGGGTYFSTLNNCIVSNNYAHFGGGMCCGTISNTIISGNTAKFYGGGALSNSLVNCLLIGNKATNNTVNSFYGTYGGGAFQSSLINCTVMNNSSYTAGGGVCGGMLNNCMMMANSAQTGGAVVAFSYDMPAILNSCTIYGNSASFGGGGLASSGIWSTGSIYVTNCIVFGNTAPSGSNYFGFALFFRYCCTAPFPTTGIGNITGDPQLVNPAGGDFRLQSNSPCINAGNNAYVFGTKDLDGNLRIVGDTVDIGAYEYQTPSSILSYAWAQQYGLPTDGSVDYVDSDGDGLNNWQEWKARTIPTNAASVLLLATPSNSVSGVTVTWQSVTNVIYYLQGSTNFASQPAFFTIQSNIAGQIGTTSYTDIHATNGGPYFYRVGVQ
ncbi:MAG: choice-of-anchor Q domain-containing protein [Limisphaerales bacterium]